MVGAQPAQALLDLLDDVAARQARGRVEASLTGLGGQHDLIPTAGEGATEDLLGRLALGRGRRAGAVERRGRAVHVRRVEEVDAEIQRRPDDAVGIRGTGGDAESGRAEADPGNAHPGRTKCRVFHPIGSSQPCDQAFMAVTVGFEP